jgi:hypothetical protein
MSMLELRMPTSEGVYTRKETVVVFNQLAVKVPVDGVSTEAYYAWLDRMKEEIGARVSGAQIAEKVHARVAPPLNTAIYYDTADYRILPTGALLRTSCNKITHAFCAFKMPQDEFSVRRDHRYVFAGEEKTTIQAAPTSPEAVAIVKRLLARKDVEHPGTFLERYLGVRGEDLEPAVLLDDYRYTFFVWLDGKDALRCSIDRYFVENLRLPTEQRVRMPVSEVELAIYPRISPEVAQDPRVVELITVLADSLCQTFGVAVTTDIKYQRAARALGIGRRA